MSTISDELVLALEGVDCRYSESLNLVGGKSPNMRYHTRLKPETPIHMTRESAQYCTALLESKEGWRIQRAHDILHALFALQDTSEESPTYGIWSWFYEEPLNAMLQPDWNWADFIGVQLVQILWRSSERLDASLKTKTAEALRHACRSIIRRNVGMGYTNIAIMGTYVTTMAGHILKDREILDYGRNRLRQFADFTEEFGGFPEYNSPTYTVVALSEFTRMMRDFPREEDLATVQDLHDRAWREIAIHWHPFSQQWAGPHSRSYRTLLFPATLDFISRGLKPDVQDLPSPAPSFEACLLPIRCPRKYLHYFVEGSYRRTERMPIRAEVPKAEAVTYIEETFAISSAEMGTFWNQSRAITAYSRNDAGPTALHVRVMRDGYDYSSAHVFCAQDGPNVLAAICFASDGGNLHCSLDPIQNASVEASDWRLRFEIQGSIVPPKLDSEFSSAESVSIDFGKNARISVRIPSVEFGGSIPHWEVLAQDDKTEVDLILYSGNARTFVFDQSFPCAIGLALTVNGDRDLNGVQVRKEDGLLKVEWPAASQAGLMVSCPIFACKQAELPLYYRQVPGNK